MTKYEKRVSELEQMGATTSDAQAVADAEGIPATFTPTPELLTQIAPTTRWAWNSLAELPLEQIVPEYIDIVRHFDACVAYIGADHGLDAINGERTKVCYGKNETDCLERIIEYLERDVLNLKRHLNARKQTD